MKAERKRGTCAYCGGEFIFRVSKQRTCSKECCNALVKKERREKPREKPMNGDPSPIRIEGDCAYVLLRKGFEAVVDLTDLHLVQGKRWRLLPAQRGLAYAVTGYSINGDFTSMHRLLLDTPEGTLVDHKDGNGLNNRRRNIRNCTPAQNSANRIHLRLDGAKSYFNKTRGTFEARITHLGQDVYLGRYKTHEEAAAAYQGAARALRGGFSSWSVDDENTDNSASDRNDTKNRELRS